MTLASLIFIFILWSGKLSSCLPDAVPEMGLLLRELAMYGGRKKMKYREASREHNLPSLDFGKRRSKCHGRRHVNAPNMCKTTQRTRAMLELRYFCVFGVRFHGAHHSWANLYALSLYCCHGCDVYALTDGLLQRALPLTHHTAMRRNRKTTSDSVVPCPNFLHYLHCGWHKYSSGRCLDPLIRRLVKYYKQHLFIHLFTYLE